MAATPGLIDAAEASDNPSCPLMGVARLRPCLARSGSSCSAGRLRRGLRVARRQRCHAERIDPRDDSRAASRRDHGDPRPASIHQTGDPELPRLRQYRRDPCSFGTSRDPFGPDWTLRAGRENRRFRIQSDDRGHGPQDHALRSPISVRYSETKCTNRWRVMVESLTTAAIAAYAYDQIDQARAQLERS